MIDPRSVLALLAAATVLIVAWVRKAPVVVGLALANFVVFVAEIWTGTGLGPAGSPMLADLAARVSYLSEPDPARLYTLVTSTFLHADIGHILGNMLVLVMLGLPFEERVGRARFFAIYFFGGIVAVLLHALWVLFLGLDPTVPLVGASGAVFGIIGAFATLYPRDQVPMFLGFIFLPRVPVFVGALVMTGLETLALLGSSSGNVAHAAHIGGAVGGIIFGLLLRPPAGAVPGRRRPRRLDYAALERLAQAPPQRTLLEKLRANEDHPDTQRAWLEPFVASLRCPRCDRPFEETSDTMLVCTQGHRERYAL